MAATALYFRVDASPAIGLGHFMRCLALAQCWLSKGGQACFIGTYNEQSIERLDHLNISHRNIGAASGSAEDPARTCDLIPHGSLIVLDGYKFDYSYQLALAEQGTLLVIDDTGHLPAYAGALLLNQNPSAARIAYPKAPKVRLLGVEYALLEQAISNATVRAGPRTPARRLLVTVGGADAGNIGGDICAALSTLVPDAQIRLIIGPLNEHAPTSRRSLQRFRNVEVCVAPVDIAQTLAWAQFAVSAAGSTALQLACIGVPSALVAVAQNQEDLGASLDEAGVAVYLGVSSALTAEQIACAARELAEDEDGLARMSSAGPRMIDGHGAARVCDALIAAKQEN